MPPDHIEVHDKDSRDLLIAGITRLNDTVDRMWEVARKIEPHDVAIAGIKQHCEDVVKNCPGMSRKKVIATAGAGAGIGGAVIALIEFLIKRLNA